VFSEQDTLAIFPLAASAYRRPRRRLWVAVSALVLAAAGAAAWSITSSRSNSGRVTRPTGPPDSASPDLRSAFTPRAVGESAFAPLRRAALDVRTRAGLAGATVATLAAGDSLAREAEGLAAMGRQSEAVDRLGAAARQWQAAREAIKQRPVRPVTAREAAQAAVTRLEQAVASRDVEAVRRVYPNLTSEEHDQWMQFFRSTDGIIPTLRIDSLVARGNRADVLIRGIYDYVPAKGTKRKREPVEYRATFEQKNGAWRLTAIH
jgi:hypothetical protein